MDEFMLQLRTGDAKKKLTLGSDILSYLEEPENSIECEDLGGFIDAVTSWMTSSNFKVSQNGLDIMAHLVDRLGSGFKLYVNSIIGPATDRLGDSRESVREKANLLFMKLMDETLEPQTMLEKLTGAFNHKNGKVREEILLLFNAALNRHSSQCLTISRFLPSIITLLGDPTATVRDAAVNALVEIYRHVGERVRMDLQRKHTIAPAKMAILTARFDTVRASGEMMPTATLTLGTTADGSRGDDETDRLSIKSIGSSKSRSSSVPAIRRGFAMPKAVVGGQAGAVDEESFMTAFDDVKKVSIYSGRQLSEELGKIRDTLTKTSNDWKVRIEALQKMRAFILAGAGSYEELTISLKSLELAFQCSVKDLRSQVVREACISIAYMSQQLHHKVDRFLEALLQNIISLIPNSAKVMSTSGIVCVRFIIQYTYSSRFIPIIASNIEGKSRDIRRHCIEFLDHLLHQWPTAPLEKQVNILSQAIKKGITDADSEARSLARKAYWGFADHFKEQADILLNSLDPTYRRLLQVGDMSNSSSSNSLNTAGRNNTVTLPRSRQSSITSSQENLLERKMSTLTRKTSGIPLYVSPVKADTLSNGSPRQTPPARSNSAIDPSAARRAHVRAQYAQRSRMGISSGASLPRPRKTSDKGMTPDSASRNGRGRVKTGGSVISLSQPGSRSTSPTSLKSYQTYFDAGSPGSVLTPIRRRSGIPRSTGPSREASPNRFGSPSPAKFRSGKAAISLAASVERPPKRPLLTEKILRQSRDAESAFANALKNYPRKRSTGGGGGGALTFDDGSDESETSSLCSDRSFEYGRRHSDDINEIIANCGSTHWADRKDGLIGLQTYFRDGRMLSAKELRRVTEIFTKMFMDAHTKVFSLFLETLMELIVSHKEDLEDWLYVLLTRLLVKLGADLLGSIQQKINRTLEVVRDSFPHKSQFNVVLRFMVDQTQTPNMKVKVGTLNYITGLASLMDPNDIKYCFELDVGLAKIITWTYEPKSPEVRKCAQQTLIALFNVNSSYCTSKLMALPRVYQDNAAEFVQKYLSSSASSPMKPRYTPNSENLSSSNNFDSSKTPRDLIDPIDDSENLNPEQVRKSLHSTANAIQNYSYDPKEEGTTGSTEVDFSAGLEEKLARLELSSMDISLLNEPSSHLKTSMNNDSFKDDEASLAIKDIIAELQSVKTRTRSAERRASMSQLIRITREGNTDVLQENFRTVFRLLLENLSDDVGSTRALAFGVLSEMLKQEELLPSFQAYTELIILKVLEAHKDEEKDVERAAENCAASMAQVIPSELVIRVLNPIIKTGEFPMNQAAIKMLTKVSEHQSNKEALLQHLGELMPGLLKAYDNPQSSVRKAAVFCMVAFYQLDGDGLQPYLEGLYGSKRKLLNLYIKRAQGQTDPVSTPPPSSTTSLNP